MRSTAAWGTVPDKLYIPTQEGKTIINELQSTLDAGIGIDFNPDTGITHVATVFCTPKDRFVRRTAYAILNGRLDVAVTESGVAGERAAQSCLWQGHWAGDVENVKTELFAPLTSFFKQVVMQSCGVFSVEEILRGEDLKLLIRHPECVPTVRACLLGWLHSHPSSEGDIHWTEENLVPYNQDMVAPTLVEHCVNLHGFALDNVKMLNKIAEEAEAAKEG